jgi:alcohol oxidase
VHSRKLVVISAGALSTPLILERSGIGQESYLKSVGVTHIISDLEGVGMNLQDHPYISEFVRVDVGPDDTSDDIILAQPETMARITKEFAEGKGPLATNFIDAAIKLRPTEDEIDAFGPKFGEVWKQTFAENPDKAVILSFIFASRPFIGYVPCIES